MSIAQRVLERFAAAGLSSLVQKYMTMLGLETAPIVKIRNSLGSKALGTCKWAPGQPTSTISIQKIVTGDTNTLERILAHEMAHHAAFLDNVRTLNDLEQQHGGALQATPYVRAYLQGVRRGDAHGEDWLRYVRIINSHMGSDFVTETSDESYVQNAETKPYFVLIGKLPNGRYGFQIGVNLSAKMKQMMAHSQIGYEAKLIKTTDPRWQHGPRIGSGKWATSPDKQDEMKRLHTAH